MSSISSDTQSPSLTCQQCHQPLLLDPSIQNLTPAQYTLIASSLPSAGPSSGLPSSSKLAQLPPTARPAAEIWSKKRGNPSGSGVAESFIMLDQSQSQSHATSRASYQPTSTYTSSADAGPSAPRQGLSSTELAETLHRLISSKTPISHPICVECITLLQSELQTELDELQKERDAYIAFEQGILRHREVVQGGRSKTAQKEREKHTKGKGKGRAVEEVQGVDEGLGEFDMEGTQEEWDMLIRRKKELAEEEERLIVELKKREEDLEAVREEEEGVRRDEEEVDREEQDFLLNHHALSTQLRHLQQALSSAETHLLLSKSLLQHLESTNVYNDAFQIGYVPLPSRTDSPSLSHVGGSSSGSGYVGTINGLRLGGRPVVDWDEINAAWGLVALCVDRVAARVGFTFAKYKIQALGSNSLISELPPSRQTYELYASPDLSAFLHNRRFSTGLICLLDCIRQLVEFGQKSTRGWPVGNLEIRKDRISGYSIRLPGLGMSVGLSMMGLGGSGSSGDDGGGREAKVRGAELSPDEHWTKACIAVLKVLKQMLIAESEAERGSVAAAAPTVGASRAA